MVRGWGGGCLAVDIQAVYAALVNDELQEQAICIELNRFELPCLKVASLIWIQAHVAHALELGARVRGARVALDRSAHKNFDASGNFALMRKHLQLLNVGHRCELYAYLLRVFAEARRLPPARVRRVRVQLAGWEIGIFAISFISGSAGGR